MAVYQDNSCTKQYDTARSHTFCPACVVQDDPNAAGPSSGSQHALRHSNAASAPQGLIAQEEMETGEVLALMNALE